MGTDFSLLTGLAGGAHVQRPLLGARGSRVSESQDSGPPVTVSAEGSRHTVRALIQKPLRPGQGPRVSLGFLGG